ncbi:PREDICTED: uncharacterized protein LOC109190291 [Ipomoea nil]|uniref:uncharacterized protein LOC109190291 n=1 Tax=Ipomoea nil TaxID=35883 RepID=UPI0009019150|nr:PREDICTED: uncharacterized protein LOC109190291 [Ipomoea nil]
MVERIHAERIRVSLGFDGLFYVNPTPQGGGGLALLWRKNDTASLLSYSKNYIDIEVNMPSFPRWRMTCYYGYSQRHRRMEAWDLIKSFVQRSTLPWVMIGDFNELLFQHEKRGGNPHPDNLLRGFGETIDQCGLTQLPMEGYRFTWEKGKGTSNCIEEMLDKVLVSDDWREIVPGARLVNNLMRKSDHSANVVEKSWEEGRRDGVQDCIVHCGNRLTRWGGDRYHKFGEKIMLLRNQQLRLRGRTDSTSLAEFQRLEGLLCSMEAQEDVYWKQRAKQHWLKNADANTRFYHRYASHRKKKNTIYKLMNDNGDWLEGNAMNAIILDYFTHIFSSGGPVDGDVLFSGITPRVTRTQNESLLRPFELADVKEALFAMAPDKAPGPDGMNPGFYQHFWDIVGSDISTFILNCLNNRVFPSGLNDTDVVLIPKKKVPEMITDFRPIALSNVIYRIMAKMITQRMKPLMEKIISGSQSAFIPDRLITDNSLVAAEVGHFLNRKQCGAVGWGALKLDMAKAYDCMEWPFLREMLLALGFDSRWVELIMLCVTTVSYNLLINGSRSSPITPTRGLRQGDPLSPYLFIICAEGLSILLQRAQDSGLIHGCKVARGAPPISHLFFADDSLLFFRANTQEAYEIRNCLLLYESFSGQKINYHKSSICYSRNTGQNDRDMVAQILGVNRAPSFGKYLGLPSFVGRNKKAVFAYIEDKIRQRIGSWNKRLLTQAGKEILLKSVAQAMPTFSMSVFLLPISTCTAIERVMNRYWWGSGTERGIHWKAWDRLCVPKKYGGMGFKDLRAFNLAMLGKQAWRLLTNPDSLVARVYKARYYPKDTFLEATIGNNPSFYWRSIMAAKDLICGGVRKRIGNGESTLIWEHPWLQDEIDPMIHTEMPQHLSGAKVVGLIDQDTKTWDPHILADIFQPDDIPRIQKIPVAPEYEDIWYWYDDPNGYYSVKSGYRRIVGNYENNSNGIFSEWLTLWKLKIPPKWKTFLWRAICDILPTTNNLLIKRVEINPIAILNVLDFDGIIYAAAILYHLWRARNGAVWDACLPTPTKLLLTATSTMKAWKMVHHRAPQPERGQGTAATARTAAAAHTAATARTADQPPLPPTAGPTAAFPPPLLPVLLDPHHGVSPSPVKCYMDASYHHGTNAAAVGAILLDANGHYLSAFTAPLIGCHSPLSAEAIACKEVLSWLKRRDELSIQVFTDCQVLQSYLSGPSITPRSYLGYAIDNCRAHISTFSYCSIIYIPRLQNSLAHTLASTAFTFDTAMYWDNVPPDSILPLL